MSSKRLPGKVLMRVCGRPLISHLYDRLMRCRNVDDIVLATSTELSDDKLYEFAVKEGWTCYRGSINNVAERLLKAGKLVHADGLVRVNGDSPLLDPELVDHAVQLFRDKTSLDLVTNVQYRTYPKGQSVEVILLNALEKILAEDINDLQKEHVTSYFYENLSNFKIFNIISEHFRGKMQLSVDTIEDFIRLQKILDVLGPPYAIHSLPQIVEVLEDLEKKYA